MGSLAQRKRDLIRLSPPKKRLIDALYTPIFSLEISFVFALMTLQFIRQKLHTSKGVDEKWTSIKQLWKAKAAQERAKPRNARL